MFKLGNFIKKFWFNIILLVFLIVMSTSILDIYYQFDDIKKENKKLMDKTELLKNAFRDNLARIGKNNRYTGKNYIAIKTILKDSLSSKINQQTLNSDAVMEYEISKDNSCDEIKNKLEKIKVAFDSLNFFHQEINIFFDTIRDIKKLNEKNSKLQENLNHIESCFIEKK